MAWRATSLDSNSERPQSTASIPGKWPALYTFQSCEVVYTFQSCEVGNVVTTDPCGLYALNQHSDLGSKRSFDLFLVYCKLVMQCNVICPIQNPLKRPSLSQKTRSLFFLAHFYFSSPHLLTANIKVASLPKEIRLMYFCCLPQMLSRHLQPTRRCY